MTINKGLSNKKRMKFAVALVLFAICIILSSFLLRIKTETFTEKKIGTRVETPLELGDGHFVDVVFNVMNPGFTGFVIDGYDNNQNIFTEEELIVSVYDDRKGDVLQQNIFPLKDQITDRSILVLMHEEIEINTRIRVRITTKGLVEKTIQLQLSSGSDMPSTTYIDGIASESSFLCAKTYYKVDGSINKTALLVVLLIVMIGAVLLFMAKRLSLPIVSDTDVSGTAIAKSINKKDIVRTVLLGVLIAALLFVFWDYIYTFSAERAGRRYIVDNVINKKTDGPALSISDETIQQKITVGEDGFSGIAFPEFPEEVNKGTVKCEVMDVSTGRIVTSGKLKLSNITKATKFLSDKVNKEERNKFRDYVILEFDKVLTSSGGKDYVISLTVLNTEAGVPLKTVVGDNIPLLVNGQNRHLSLEIVALEKQDTFVKGFFWKVAIISSVLALAVLIICLSGIKMQVVYLISALILGGCFSIVVPPYCVPDERSHIDTAYILSNELLGIDNALPGEFIYKRQADIDGTKEKTEDVSIDRYREVDSLLMGQISKEEEALIPAYGVDISFNATMLHYFPQAIGFTVARLARLSYESMLFFGRWANLLAFVALMIISIRKIPYGKGLFAIIGLFPMVLQQAASCSYDTLMIGAGFVFIAYYTFIVNEERVSLCELAMLIGSGLILALSKGGVYIPVLGVLLLLPVKKRNHKRIWLLYSCTSLLCVFAAFLVKFSGRIQSFITSSESYQFSQIKSESKLYTVNYFINKPAQTVRVLQNTLVNKGDDYLKEMIGSNLGRLNITIPWFIILGFAVALAIVAAKISRNRILTVTGLYYIVLFFMCVGLILVALMLDMTPVGTEVISGVQGRYFLPAVPLILAIFIQNSNKAVEDHSIGLKGVSATVILNVFTLGFVFLSVLK